jgi:hypothetical protein
MSYLPHLYLLVYSGVFVFVVLCTLCCHFLYIVHFLFPLRYSQTFIDKYKFTVQFIGMLRDVSHSFSDTS